MSWSATFVAKDPQTAAVVATDPKGPLEYAPPELRIMVAAQLKAMEGQQPPSAVLVTSAGHLDANLGGRAEFTIQLVQVAGT